jgi:hypothetical protein
MRGEVRLRRYQRYAFFGAALYVFVLLASPFEHHELACRDPNPLHCPSCASHQLGSDPQPVIAPGACHLTDAGQAVSILVVPQSVILSVRTTGRSPPTAL